MLQKIVDFLHGKKAVIIGVFGLVVAYLVQEGQVSPNLGTLLSGIIALLGGGADFATKKLGVSAHVNKK